MDGYRPTIAITLGDPAGIGPEVIVKALADPVLRHKARYIIYGMNELLAYAADLAEYDVFWWRDQFNGRLRAECLNVHWFLTRTHRKRWSIGADTTILLHNTHLSMLLK